MTTARRGTLRRAARGAFVLPGLALTVVLFTVPALVSVWFSLLTTSGVGPAPFVGLDNYARLVGDAAFIHALLVTVEYAVITVFGTVGIGTLLALAIDANVPAAGLFRLVILAPAFLPVAYTGMIWVIGFDPAYGWANQILGSIDPTLSQPWLADPGTAIVIIALIQVVQYAGWPMAIIWAALQDIPSEVKEAALLDGAGPIAVRRFVYLPMIREVLATVVLLQSIAGLLVFTNVWVMTGGGPGGATNTIPTLAYTQAFRSQQFGYGSATAVTMTILLALFVLIYLRVFRPRGIYAR